ncbi:uncharacterized protein LOC126370936 [Pectinophora gossypiella]|uniref:uncharacterized protein LOC126370936 n=1 Tax=Pectinophora gossypiella TaxID=13191 RepID=UPI00214E5B4C|nr:uncharacterized protein LOC126370936 [Pectinophora gossypiella]
MAGAEALEGCAPALVAALRAHGAGEVTCCDVSADGARLLSGGGDRALRAWRWAGGAGWQAAAAAPRAHRYGVTAARWAPGGALAASGGVDGAARVWAARSLAPRRLLAAPGAPALRALCWAAPARLLCGYDDGAAVLWDVRGAAQLARLRQHEGALHALAAPAGGALLLAACTAGVLKVFDLHEACRRTAAGLPEPTPLLWEDGAHDLGALCCAAEGDAAATGGHDARVRLWAVRREAGGWRVAPGAALDGHAAAVTALRWARGVLASAALDRTARLWSAAGVCLCVLHAHDRYLTCVALAPDLRYMVTGSNDKTVRTWALGDFTIDDELEPPCNPMSHFGVGDLEGIGPVDDEDLLLGEAEAGAGPGAEEGAGAARLQTRLLQAHGGAVNCIAVSGPLLATACRWVPRPAPPGGRGGAEPCCACSDGVARVFRREGPSLRLLRALGARGYPALAADFGAGGALLLTAGLDGPVRLWDVESGVLLRSLQAPAEEGGGCGGRGCRVSPHRPPLLLLAADAACAALWPLDEPDPEPAHVYGGHVEAATCCAWSACGRAAAVGGAEGELRVLAPPPRARLLRHQAGAHDLGVQSCDFAARGAAGLPDDAALLATAGSDGLLKLWRLDFDEEGEEASLTALAAAMAHGGGALCVRWGVGAALASAGADGWLRVWRAALGAAAAARLAQLAAVPALGAASAPAAAILDARHVALGSLSGELAVWRLPVSIAEEGSPGDDGAEEGAGGEGATDDEEDAGLEPRWWGAAGVARWIKEYVTRAPEAGAACAAAEAALLRRAAGAGLRGQRLLDAPLPQLLALLAPGGEEGEQGEEGAEGAEDAENAADSEGAEAAEVPEGAEVPESAEAAEAPEGAEALEGEVRARLQAELRWLRRAPPPPDLAASPRALIRVLPQAALAPHALLCPLSHALQREPARAADGVTYDRAALHSWFLAADGAVSAVSGRRLRNARVLPNYRARDMLRDFLRQHAADV